VGPRTWGWEGGAGVAGIQGDGVRAIWVLEKSASCAQVGGGGGGSLLVAQ
jgi:hypothetical protein